MLCNTAVQTLTGNLTSQSRKRNQEYNSYDEHTRLKIARSAMKIGINKTARKFSNLNESSVCGMKMFHLQRLGLPDCKIHSLPHLPRGAQLMLGPDIDNALQKWTRHVCVNGGVINNRIVMGAAEGIVKKLQPSILKSHGRCCYRHI